MESYFHHLNDIEVKEIIPGFYGRFVHLSHATIAFWNIKKGSSLPEHHHIQEQVTNLLDGEFEMTIEGETRVCQAGDVAVIPANAKHSGKALTDCVIIDIFQPGREDYR